MGKPDLKINGRIRASQVRLVDEKNNQVGVVELFRALRMAGDAGLDLVEVSPMSEPPVCKIMDYGKWLYDQKRKMREGHKKTQHVTTALKEIRLRPETDQHDLTIKLNHARQFLEKGHKVQFTMFFRGRQMLHGERGVVMLDEIAKAMEDVAKIEWQGGMQGKRMTLMLLPNK